MISYQPPRTTVQQVLQRHWCEAKDQPVQVQKVLSRIRRCRTSTLGYHVYKCRSADCEYIKYQYHSCRDRHCPGCGAVKKQQWIEARMQELLPVKYYHVVFTLPHELNSIVLGNRKTLFKLLFDAAAATLLRFAEDPKYLGALPGIISVLHTWGQQLSFHPHVHSIVSGGGIVKGNGWREAKKNDYQFLFPVKALQKVFRGKFLQGLRLAVKAGEVTLPQGQTDLSELLERMYRKHWVVYAKAPLGSPYAVIEYLGRYTHKVAISNHRISSINDKEGTVTFDYKDYADKSTKKQMTLTVQEFVRRFALHILPERFTKIRTYGYLANRGRRQRIGDVLKGLKLPVHKGLVKLPLHISVREQYGIDITECPWCHEKTLQLVMVHYPTKQVEDG